MQPPNPYSYQPPPGRIRRFTSWYRPQSRLMQIVVGAGVLAAIVFVLSAVITGAVQGVQSSLATATPTSVTNSQPTQAGTLTSAAKPTQKLTQSVPLAEALTFHGDISGMLTTGINPHPLTHDNPTPAYVQKPDGTYFDPAPTWTQCSDFSAIARQDYVAVIVGNVGSMRYAVTIEINEDNPAYTNPGTELRPGDTNSGGSIEVYEMGGKNRRWQQVYGPDGQDTVIVLHAGRVSGTVDAWMATTDLSQKDSTGTLHMQGNWRCG